MIDEYQIFLNKMDLEIGAWYFFEKQFLLSKRNKLFNLYSYQKELLQTYKNNELVIIDYPPQKGLTTLTAFYLLWKTVYFKIDSIIVVTDFQRRLTISSTIFNIWTDFATILPVEISHCNPNVIRFKNNSYIYLLNDPRDLYFTDVDLIWIDDYHLFGMEDSFNLIELFPISIMDSPIPQAILTGSNKNNSNCFTSIWNDAKYQHVTMSYDSS